MQYPTGWKRQQKLGKVGIIGFSRDGRDALAADNGDNESDCLLSTSPWRLEKAAAVSEVIVKDASLQIQGT